MKSTTTFNNISFEKLYEAAKELTLEKNDSYLKSYPEFINYFKRNKNITEHDLVISSHFIYGWMPTILTLDIQNKKLILDLLNKAKGNELLGQEELEVLKKAINNSMVGLSKLLHFINPKNYVIWDSRIYRYSTGLKSQFGIGNTNKYVLYVEAVHDIASHPNYKLIHDLVIAKLGYEVQPTRVIELVMFQADRNKK